MVMDRGQIHTLEAFIAALLIIGALLFASQATAVTPLSASTSNQHIENQQQSMGEDVLAIAAEDGSLQEALRYYNTSGESHRFGDTDPDFGYYTGFLPDDHPMNQSLNEAFDEGVYAYNVELRYLDQNQTFQETDLIVMGTPSDNAVIATTTVTLFEDDEITYGGADDDTIEDANENGHFWAPNVDEESSVYNVVEVRITIWRM